MCHTAIRKQIDERWSEVAALAPEEGEGEEDSWDWSTWESYLLDSSMELPPSLAPLLGWIERHFKTVFTLFNFTGFYFFACLYTARFSEKTTWFNDHDVYFGHQLLFTLWFVILFAGCALELTGVTHFLDNNDNDGDFIFTNATT